MKPRAFGLILLLLLLAAPASAQEETWQAFQPRPEQTQLRIWSSEGVAYAQVILTFPHSGFRVSDWGEVQRNGNDFSLDFKVEQWTGPALAVITAIEHVYRIGPLSGGNYALRVSSRGNLLASRGFDPAQIVERWEAGPVPQVRAFLAINTVRNVAYAYVTVIFPDDGYRIVDWGGVERNGNETSVSIKVERWMGLVTTRAFSVRHNYVFGELPAGPHTVRIYLNGAQAYSISFTAPVNVLAFHPLDSPAFFVRQHYLDFLNREPDSDGLTFWYDQIVLPCQGNMACMQTSRINPSAAFFTSIEFQQTGFFVYRLHKAAYGEMPRMAGFFADTQEIGRGVIVNQRGWQEKLEANTQLFVNAYVRRPDFMARYPETLQPEQYVDGLNANTVAPAPGAAGSPADAGPLALTNAERDALVQGLKNGTETRATVLRKVAENAEFARKEYNRAFVLMQYFGYLRRNPDDPPDNNWEGYKFWLKKLEDHGGNYISAEMIQSFITSGEYRRRFEQ